VYLTSKEGAFVLAYLDALVAAISRQNRPEIERLLAHPLARILSREAHGEALSAAGSTAKPAVPLRLLQLRHQTAQLLGDRVAAAEANEFRAPLLPPARSVERHAPARQMELPLSA
jgi:hypothetical protein